MIQSEFISVLYLLGAIIFAISFLYFIWSVLNRESIPNWLSKRWELGVRAEKWIVVIYVLGMAIELFLKKIGILKIDLIIFPAAPLVAIIGALLINKIVHITRPR